MRERKIISEFVYRSKTESYRIKKDKHTEREDMMTEWVMERGVK